LSRSKPGLIYRRQITGKREKKKEKKTRGEKGGKGKGKQQDFIYGLFFVPKGRKLGGRRKSDFISQVKVFQRRKGRKG